MQNIFKVTVFMTMLATASGLVSCQTDHNLAQPSAASNNHEHHHVPHGRPGLHGMVLFGSGPHYLAHIPMLTEPHNEQLILKVSMELEDGTPLQANYSDAGFSVRPSSIFPLDDLATGQLTSFTGTIHRGNFEHGGPAETSQVTFVVEKVLISRRLPSDNSTAGMAWQGFMFGTPDNIFLVNKISAERSYQQIVRADLDTSPENLVPDGILAIQIAVRERLTPAQLPVAAAQSDEDPFAAAFTVQNIDELWCLKGPDFFAICD